MIISRTPLRISFAGGGTDLPSYYETGYGAVLNAAIDKYIYVIVQNSFDGKIHLKTATGIEVVDEVSQLQHDITRVCLLHTEINSGIEITSIAEIPGGTGLGSSSCYTVGLLNALYAFKHTKDIPLTIIEKNPITLLHTPPNILAETACDIEINQLAAPIGKQDQFACAFGGMNYFQFNADGSVDRQSLTNCSTLNTFNQNLMIFYIGGTRSANAILKEQNNNTNKNLQALDTMRNQAKDLYNNPQNLPQILKDGWELKKSLASTISNSYINNLYAIALNNGAIAGKLLGAGGAGFMLFYCPLERQNDLRNAMLEQGLIQEMPVTIGYAHGSEIIYYG